MRVGILVDECPKETFVIRQAEALDATVFAGQVPTQGLDRLQKSCAVCIEGGGFKPGLSSRLVKRLFPAHNCGVRLRLSAAQRSSLRNQLCEQKIQVLLAQFAPNGMRAIEVCEALSIPLVVHCHGYDVTQLIRFDSYLRRLKRLFERADAFIAVSTKMKKSLIGMGCPEHKVEVIPCGVPISEFQMQQRQPSAGCHFLFVGRLVPKKSPVELIRAFEYCATLQPDVTLTIIGDGPLASDMEQAIAQLSNPVQVRYLGAQPIEAVKKALQAADCYVQHSVIAPNGDEEGWPVSIAEAAACGLPVIATTHAGIVDQVVQGESGFLVAEHDWRAMGEKMAFAAANPDWRVDASVKSRAHIEAHGSFESSIAKIEAMLQRVLSPSGV